MSADLSTRISHLRSLLPTLESAIQSFVSETSRRGKPGFRLLQTIKPSQSEEEKQSLRTLYILDSSFNPPSLAHRALCLDALRNSPSQTGLKRLLLLFSTHNADKSADAKTFIHRVATMILFAEDLSTSLPPPEGQISIDVALTSSPYYTDKTRAIESLHTDESEDPYPSKPTHVHLVGYDTFTRVLDPKYYSSFSPPLSALRGYFGAGHRFRVALRPADQADPSSSEWGTEEDQRKRIEGLAVDEELGSKGWDKTWGQKIEIAGDGNGDKWVKAGKGVSSTRIRNAAGEGRWDEVKELCTEGAAAWIKEMGVYSTSGEKREGNL
ncbi:hypothetical protein M501DRAFT_930627 [Patellaria atrata CBS 101060]|uniref:Nicotinamide-nucleotide adenylyltransferase n=1 Tax=Patellaria atrata CBS 101060 TaxID=1346257 RepID=A0A9P4VSR4_9PEZI|nr:hypothetical protein M501DRAFT_930627 [Patellaria atrata CBS 101060]